MQRSISVFSCALNFCVALSQCAKTENFLRYSTYALRMVENVVVTFRSLVVALRDLYPIREHSLQY
jgi:hypothetical protein